jgi:hypothetical protein
LIRISESLQGVNFPHPAAGNEVVWQDFLQVLRLMALLAGIGTSFTKTASGFRMDGGGDFTAQRHDLFGQSQDSLDTYHTIFNRIYSCPNCSEKLTVRSQ